MRLDPGKFHWPSPWTNNDADGNTVVTVSADENESKQTVVIANQVRKLFFVSSSSESIP